MDVRCYRLVFIQHHHCPRWCSRRCYIQCFQLFFQLADFVPLSPVKHRCCHFIITGSRAIRIVKNLSQFLCRWIFQFFRTRFLRFLCLCEFFGPSLFNFFESRTVSPTDIVDVFWWTVLQSVHNQTVHPFVGLCFCFLLRQLLNDFGCTRSEFFWFYF